MITNPSFKSKLITPLETVSGQELRAVGYGVLIFDKPKFSLESPNEFGVCFVDLCFNTSILNVSWGFDYSLRNEDLHYHIETRIQLTPQVSSEFTTTISANESSLWREILDRPLTNIEIYGLKNSPQTIRFQFQSVAIVLSLGWSTDLNKPADIGDGDEIIFFTDEEWNQIIQQDQYKGWVKLWSFPR